MHFKHPLLLASGSPRRRQLLAEAGFTFSPKVKSVPEDFPSHMPAAEVPAMLAQRKAEALREALADEVVLAADTVVVVDGDIFNKPADEAEAFAMLSRLSGRMHQVITGVCLLSREKTVTLSDLTEVYFRPLSADEINYYIRQYRPYDKAGAYGVQEWIGMIGIQKMVGSYFNVMGLPVHRVYEELMKW
jgi:septum formation protein